MVAQIRIDPTPNPDSLKFTVSVAVSARPVTITAATAGGDPLAKKLFEVQGVKSIFMISNFVTVTKEPDATWDSIANQLGEIIANHF